MIRFLLFPLMVMVAGCAFTPRIDPSAFLPDKSDRLMVPGVCKKAYDNFLPDVAVVKISNNTSFDYAKVVEEQVTATADRDSAGGVAAAAGRRSVAAVWGETERKRFVAEAHRVEKEFTSKMSEAFEDAVINELVQIGGCKVHTRNELKKVFNEQKFQQSGVVDDSKLVKIGKTAGVKYLITGSVDNVKLGYNTNSLAKKTIGQNEDVVSKIISSALEVREGWQVDTEATLRVLDVESGQVVESIKLKGRDIAGKMNFPPLEILVGSIKASLSKTTGSMRNALSRLFPIKGYVLQTRTSNAGDSRIALINVGQKHGVKSGQKMSAFVFEEVADPFTGKTTCDQQKLPVEIIVSDQLQDDKAWCVLNGEPNSSRLVKTGLLIERAPLDNSQSFFNALGL